MMEGCSSSDATRRNSGKRPHKESCYSDLDEEDRSPKCVNNDYALRISLLDQNLNFVDINWIKVCDFLNKISESWNFLAFGAKHNSVIVNGGDEITTKSLLCLEKLVIDETHFPVRVQILKSACGRGIVYNKVLSTLTNDQVREALAKYGIQDYHRLQKSNPDSGEKVFTGSIILKSENKLPSSIIVSKIELIINNLAPKPMICYHCGILGHTKARCLKLHIQYCRICYYEHEENDKCITQCKQCQGQHISFDSKCKVMIKEIQILKIKESHDLNYFDAKSVNESLNKPLIADPVDSLRAKIQEISNRNSEYIFRLTTMQKEREKSMEERNEMIKIINQKENEITLLIEEKNSLQADHNDQIEKYHDEAVSVSEKFREALQQADDLEKNLGIARKKYEDIQKTLEAEKSKRKNEKMCDSHYIEGFVNSSEAIQKAYTAYHKDTKTSKVQLSFPVKVKTPRNNSQDKAANKMQS